MILSRRRSGESAGDIVTTSKFCLTAYGQGNWGRAPKGHIALQDYGGAIEFRSVELRPLSGP